ncbi:aminotransferase class I/II-fold pyridoxal phosphate-dependent enzyme [Rubrobacter tropicus]|uniref:Aminotransferase n=1 Tax=Rubrobacter tropicus TaxID=2653851 RepID=A0A6G8Q8R2_9ACTN|nr:aminotransferase class I/II-fold pyridoxal phosphate-dependent enzyme [Rubrobacter tropicus]QIN82822.1 aminotransferase class I/II-fold pyridoxal phosphate-dependent enzyme [Rubrobacter tropicus]
MVEGWASHPGSRHHGAHGEAASRAMGGADKGFLDFSQNINPLGAPPATLEAARRALVEDTGRYPDLSYTRLREALGGYLGVDPGSVVPTNGGAEALFLAARAAGKSGKALVLEPTFSEYAAAAEAAGMEIVRRVCRRPGNGFRIAPEVFEDLRGVAAVFLCNPNNPTGEVLGREEVLEIATRVGDAGAVLILDEAFVDFVPEASVASEMQDGLFVARSFTKFFAIPGLRLGCLVCHDVPRAQALQPSWPVNAVAAAAGIAAAGDSDFAERSVRGVARLRDGLSAALGSLPELEVFPSAANFLLVRGPAAMPERLARLGILVRGCEPFAGLGPGFFRVAVRGEEENDTLVDGIRRAL